MCNFLFNVKKINKFYDKISRKAWLKFECDTFDYGYYYAMYSTLMNITAAFGVQVPLLYFLMAFVLLFKLFADGVKFTNIHGWDLEGGGKLFELVLSRLVVGTIICHLLLFNQCFWGKLYRTMILNIIMTLFTTIVYFMLKRYPTAKLKMIVKTFNNKGRPILVFSKPTKYDSNNWVYRYTHPYLYFLGPERAHFEMKDFESNSLSGSKVSSIDSRVNNQIEVNNRLHRRFNKPLIMNFDKNENLPNSEDKIMEMEQVEAKSNSTSPKREDNLDGLQERDPFHEQRLITIKNIPKKPPLNIITEESILNSFKSMDSQSFTMDKNIYSSRFRKDGVMLDRIFQFKEEENSSPTFIKGGVKGQSQPNSSTSQKNPGKKLRNQLSKVEENLEDDDLYERNNQKISTGSDNNLISPDIYNIQNVNININIYNIDRSVKDPESGIPQEPTNQIKNLVNSHLSKPINNRNKDDSK